MTTDLVATGKRRMPARTHSISFNEALLVWLRVAILSFGGPAGQIAVMHRILVEEKNWIRRGNSCTHSITACCCRGRKHSNSRSISAGCCTGPSAASSPAALHSARHLRHHGAQLHLRWLRQRRVVEALFFGLKAAVLAIVIQAVVRIGKRSLRNR